MKTWLKPGVNETSSRQLLHRARRHDVDLVDHDAFDRLAHFALSISLDRRVPNFIKHIIAFTYFAEGRVLVIEPVHGCETDEELRARRIRIRFARHRDHAALMRMIVKLGFDLVT